MPIFSLPNAYGIGSIGKSALKFIDFLNEAKQDFWQILPTNPTSYGDSPYQAFSTIANNPYFIDIEDLIAEHLLNPDDKDLALLKTNINRIDYGKLFQYKIPLLKKCYLRVHLFDDEFKEFKQKNKWVKDYALFMVLKEKHHYCAWNQFEEKYKLRQQEALTLFYNQNKDDVEAYMFMQFLYARQWKKLKEYAKSKQVEIIGDMPIYVSYDSVDVWQDPQLFLLDENLLPSKVAGVPPDYFSKTGQLWGNPLYNYNQMKKDHYKWWVKRIQYAFKQFDYVRIDHFRGFSAFYAIDYGRENAIVGTWLEGPKMALFNEINKQLNFPKIIAENLGLLDDDVLNLLKQCNYPGMRILQFEMYSKENLKKLKLASKNNILYPGTHDNEPFLSWYLNHASKIEQENVKDELNFQNVSELQDALIKYCYLFPFDYCIIAMQDILLLSEDSRINTPGSQNGNWTFQFKDSDFNHAIAKKLAMYKEKYVSK